MNIEIQHQRRGRRGPAEIAAAVEDAGYVGLAVSVNDGERLWVSTELEVEAF